MDASLEQVKDVLSSQAATLDEEIASDKKNLVAKEKKRKRIAAALSALTGGSAQNGSKPERKCVTKDLVIQLVEGFLSDNGELTRNDLEGLTKSKVRELGYSLSGFALRMNEALNMPQFSVSQAGQIGFTRPPSSTAQGLKSPVDAARRDASAVPGNVPVA